VTKLQCVKVKIVVCAAGTRIGVLVIISCRKNGFFFSIIIITIVIKTEDEIPSSSYPRVAERALELGLNYCIRRCDVYTHISNVIAFSGNE